MIVSRLCFLMEAEGRKGFHVSTGSNEAVVVAAVVASFSCRKGMNLSFREN